MTNPANEQDILFTLRNQARPLGLWVGMHAHFDAARGGGPFYVMERKRTPEQRNESLLRYATAEEVGKFLDDFADNYTNMDLIRVVPSGRD